MGNFELYSLPNNAKWCQYNYLDDFDGNTCFTKYSTFQVLNAATEYRLVVTGYSRDASDSLTSSNGQPFVVPLSRS